MYLPIWILYWFPVALLFNYSTKAGLVRFFLWMFKKVPYLSIDEETEMRVWGKSLLAAAMAEAIGLFVLFLLEMKLFPDSFVEKIRSFLCIAFAIVVIFNFLFQYVWTLFRVGDCVTQKFDLSFLLTAATAPYLFLVLHA